MATENALLDESFSETAESPRGGRVRELLRLLVKAQKAQRLYEGKNEVSERLEKEFYERLTEFLRTETAGLCCRSLERSRMLHAEC